MAELNHTPIEYREALERALPCGGQMQLNIRTLGTMIQVTIRCGQLRWCQTAAIAARPPEEVAAGIDRALREWVLQTFAAVEKNPKQQRAFNGFKLWLSETPTRRTWLYGQEKDAA